MKLLVPAGFMPTLSGGTIVVTICSGTAPQTMVMTLPGSGEADGSHEDAGTHDRPCAFSGLVMPALGGADPVLLAIAIAAVIALGLRPAVPPAIGRPARMRPPLRAPPAAV